MTTPTAARPNHRLWIPTTICALAVVLFLVSQAQPELERNIKAWIKGSIMILAGLRNALWVIFRSRVPWKTRLLVVILGGLALAGFSRLVEVDGTIDGTGRPRWVWKNSRAPLFGPAPNTSPAPPPSTAANTNTNTNPPARADLEKLLSDVPQFFGPARDGVIRGANLATDWNATPPKLLWRQPIGGGWSAFAVVGTRAFTQEQRGENELVSCYEIVTGRLLWAHTNQARFFQWQSGEGTRATPTVLAERVFAIGGTGILDCLDAATGRLVWSRNVLTENKLGNLTWGVSASPLVFDESVVVTGGQTAGPTVLAYHRETGAPLWRAGTDKASYSSPILATIAGRRVILSVNAASFTVHDSTNGTVLLDQPWSNDKWPKAAQPVVLDHDRVFLSAGYGIGCQMLQLKFLNDGKLVATELWSGRSMKNQFNSTTHRDGFLYGLDDGFLACVEAATGQRRWKDGRFGSGQSLLVDDLVLIQSEPGPIVLARARPDAYEELARLPALSGKTWTHPTLAGRLLLVRNNHEAACYELPAAGTATNVSAVKAGNAK